MFSNFIFFKKNFLGIDKNRQTEKKHAIYFKKSESIIKLSIKNDFETKLLFSDQENMKYSGSRKHE